MKKVKLLCLLLGFSFSSMAQNFVTTWESASGNLEITIPTHPGNSYTYNYNIDWGDGSGVLTNQQGDVSHSYPGSGPYTVTISGDFPAIFFKKSADKNKITAITDWGGSSFGWQTFSSAFEGCVNLNSLPTSAPNLTSVNDLSFMFKGATSLNSDLNSWDVSGIDYMRGMFSGASSFNGNITSWNMANVQDIALMFNGATSFNANIGSWNTASVTNMDGTFSNATSFNQELNWNTGSVTSMNSMFAGACSFNQIISFDIADVINMNYMLSGSGLTGCIYTLTLENWVNQTVQSGVVLGADGLFHSNPSARTNLISNSLWTINGDNVNKTDVCRDPSWFVTEWNISSGPTITIPTSAASGTYLYDVDWNGDGVFESADIGYTGNASHTYPSNATPQVINIRGVFPSIHFGNTGSKALITSILQWGDIEWKSFKNAFYGCTNLEYDATDVPDLSAVTDFSLAFTNCSKFNGAIGNWDVSNVTNMNHLFAGASIFNQELSEWDVSNVTNMGNMFYLATSFNNNLNNTQNPNTLRTGIDGWNVGSVTNMNGTFRNCSSFNQDIGSWDVSAVSTMANMFFGASSFNQDLSNWQLTALTNAEYLFATASSFNNGSNNAGGNSINNWDMDQVTTTNHMFAGASSFDREISNWDVSSVTNMRYMFYLATSFNNGNNSLQNAQTLRNGIDGWNTSGATTMNRMFGSASTFNRNIGSWNVESVSDMGYLFNQATAFDQDLSDWRLNSLTNAEYMFANASSFNNGSNNFNSRSINDWDVDMVTNMNRMFAGASSFNREISSWNTSSVTNMTYMFYLATSFNNGSNSQQNAQTLRNGIDGWTTSSVTNMSWMFREASDFNRPIGNWDLSGIPTSSSTAMASMLDDCGMGWTNYDITLNGWDALSTTPSGITLGANNLFWCNSGTARTNLGWTFAGDAQSCSTIYALTKPISAVSAATSSTNQTLTVLPPIKSASPSSKITSKSASNNTISVSPFSNGNIVIHQTNPNVLNTSVSVEVFNLNGQMVSNKTQTNTNNRFNLSTLAKGVYIVKVQTNNKIEVKKITIP